MSWRRLDFLGLHGLRSWWVVDIVWENTRFTVFKISVFGRKYTIYKNPQFATENTHNLHLKNIQNMSAEKVQNNPSFSADIFDGLMVSWLCRIQRFLTHYQPEPPRIYYFSNSFKYHKGKILYHRKKTFTSFLFWNKPIVVYCPRILDLHIARTYFRLIYTFFSYYIKRLA